MFLDLDKTGVPMKQVYTLAAALQQDPKKIASVQALTLNASKPLLGLKGTHGLYASPAWWAGIDNRSMPLLTISGTIQRVYVAGQDSSGKNNAIDLLSDDGRVHTAGIYVNDKADIAMFRVGCLVALVYALDELKDQPTRDGGINHAEIALEMAVSLAPVVAIDSVG